MGAKVAVWWAVEREAVAAVESMAAKREGCLEARWVAAGVGAALQALESEVAVAGEAAATEEVVELGGVDSVVVSTGAGRAAVREATVAAALAAVAWVQDQRVEGVAAAKVVGAWVEAAAAAKEAGGWVEGGVAAKVAGVWVEEAVVATVAATVAAVVTGMAGGMAAD